MDSGKNPMNNDKSLCLYCDKAFANLNDQENHVERDHKTILKSSRGKGSRKSERITKISTTELFPGCFYCNNRKLASRSDDLESLFQHLMTAHNEVYYGCKCRVRMQDKVALLNHMKNCKIGGGDVFVNDSYENEKEQELLPLVEKVNKKVKTKKSQVVQCDSPSESEDTTHQYHHSRSNAINKKSENNNSSNNSNSSRKSYYVKRKNNSKLPSSSSSTISSSSKASDEYIIPITRQKLKEPVVISSPQKNRTTSNKKSSKASSSSSSTSSLISTTENKNQQANALSSSTSSLFSLSSSSLAAKVQRTKTSKLLLNFQNNNTNGDSNENSTSSSIAAVKNEIASCEFDEDFYKNISCNIRLNLDSFIDGKAERLQNKKFNIENVGSEQMQNDTNNHQHQQLSDINHEREIHEATSFELLPPPFPALLTTEQYGFGDSNPNKNKRQFTKNSWKWRWDLIKKYKYVNEGGKIVKKVKQITTGLKDLSQLDMWTQLTMRSRYENLNEQHHFDDNLSMRMIKTQKLDQLNGIIDSRLIPEINIEQLQQMLVKEELVESDEAVDDFTETEYNEQKSDVLNMLQLTNSSRNSELSPASLSGEWARPRCFMCIDCGQEFDLMKSLNDHKNSEHPYVVSAHYEVVGRENLEQKLYKNLFLPKKALNTIESAILINSDSKSNEASSSSQDSSNLADLREKECTKCRKIIKYSNEIDIYRHILDCIEDKVWMQAKRRSKYRRSRRKGKKNTRKIPTRVNIDLKKNTSSPLMKDIVEGENSTLSISISNPHTPNEEKITVSSSLSNNLKTKNENFINTDEGINIKSFFRISKTTPNLPQRMVVQMLQMPNSHNSHNNNNNSHRHLRSSVKKFDENNKKSSSQVSANESNEGNGDKNKKDETINLNIDSNIEIENTINHNTTVASEQSTTPLVLTSLHVSTPEKCKTPLNSPTNSTTSSLVSPTSCSSVPKKKKKLNDCIAMLTCKIQEKMGVNFFNSVAEKSSEETKSQDQQQLLNVSPSLPSPPLSLLSLTPSPSICITNVPQSITTPVHYNDPVQNEVIDLSIKKASAIVEETSETIQDETQTRDQESKMLSTESMLHQKSQEETIILEEKDESLDIMESFKISISRDKIPDLDEIIEKQNVITVSNLKISESERKAFEEQKNRIMQILSKKTLNPKKTPVASAKRVVKKIPVKKPSPLKKDFAKKTVKFSKNTTIIDEQKEEHMDDSTKNLAMVEEVLELKESNVTADKLEQVETTVEVVSKEPEIVKTTKKGSTVKAKKPLKTQKFKAKTNSEIENMEPFILLEKIDSAIGKFSESTNQKVLDKAIEVKSDLSNDKIHLPPKEKVLFPSKTSQKASISFPTISSSTSEENELIQSKIEQAIKNTNRIRCRRLSVVVDPIMHLPTFQKNRKIRLTNNSQQNGFYDLLANDQLLNALKNAPQLKNEIKKLEAKKATIGQAIKEVKAAVSKETSTKNKRSKRKASKYASGKVMKVTRKKKKSKPKTPDIAKLNDHEPNAITEVPSDEIEILEKTTEPKTILKDVVIERLSQEQDKNLTVHKINKTIKPSVEEIPQTPMKTPTKASKIIPKKALLDSISISLIAPQKVQKELPVTPEGPSARIKESQKKVALVKKLTAKKTKVENVEEFSNTALCENDREEQVTVVKKQIDSENSVIKKVPPRKAKKITTDNLVISEEKSSKLDALEVETMDAKLSLDISLSSDTSNENDIPLAKLIAPKASQNIEYEEKIINKKSLPKEATQKLSKQRKDEPKDEEHAFRSVFQSKSVIKNDETKVEGDKQRSVVVQKDAKHKKEVSRKKVCNKEGSELQPKETSSSKSDSDKFEVFSINEDSFFNEDNDVDQANDKINALVNNIINSSELVDSENEKQIEGGKQQETKCETCNKIFRNEKVLEKHIKTNTHLLKEKRKEKKHDKEVKITPHAQQNAIVADETKVFRTKGALKTFDNIPTVQLKSDPKSFEEFKPIVEDSTSFVPIKINDADDDDDDDDEELSTKDKIFDSLFSNIENKLQAAAKNEPLPKFNFPKLSHHDSESSTASWDLKHDADIDWNTGAVENNLLPNFTANLAKNTMPTAALAVPLKTKVVKSKETAVSIPTKSLIMGKIFKKHRDREKQKTPQADAPNNKPGIKNSLDEIFDHLKNTAEIDDKVLTCPSPKTLLKNSAFSPQSSNSNDMLETASQSNKNVNNNNNIYKSKSPLFTSTPEKTKIKDLDKTKLKQKKKDAVAEEDGDEDDGIGKRKSSRRCAIKTKTFAETWSSDEYEELHDTNDIISIINEIEKRESIKKRKEANLNFNDTEVSSILKTSDNNKKKVQLQFPSTIKRRKISTGHKSDDEKLKDHKTPQQKSQLSLKKRRMSCFVPSTAFKSENISAKSRNAAALIKSSPLLEQKIINLKSSTITIASNSSTTTSKVIVSGANKNVLKNLNNTSNTSASTAALQNTKKKAQKHRKRPRNKVKNIAYDSDSDYELNVSKKAKVTLSNAAYSDSESGDNNQEDDSDYNDDEFESPSQINNSTYKNELTTMTKEPTKLLPNDLNAVANSKSTAISKAAIHQQQLPQQNEDNSLESACNRTKRHSSEKLYYWSSSSDSEIEHGDMADGGENEDSMIPQQPEQHGWIVGSHKKLVTLLAHAKIKNKIN